MSLLPLAIAFAPFLFAITRGKGGDGWKITTCILCLCALIGSLFILPGLLFWLGAWATAAAASSAAANHRMQTQMLQAIARERAKQ